MSNFFPCDTSQAAEGKQFPALNAHICWSFSTNGSVLPLLQHRYIKPLFLVLGRGLAQFKRYLNIIKCMLECPLDLHIYPFSRTKGGKIFREYLIYCFWVRLSGRKSHQLPTKLQFSPINMTDKLFEKLSNQSNSNLT